MGTYTRISLIPDLPTKKATRWDVLSLRYDGSKTFKELINSKNPALVANLCVNQKDHLNLSIPCITLRAPAINPRRIYLQRFGGRLF
jgi:hypothetical protein